LTEILRHRAVRKHDRDLRRWSHRVHAVPVIASRRCSEPVETCNLFGSGIQKASAKGREYVTDNDHALAVRLDVVSRIARVASASLGLEELLQVVYETVTPFFKHEAYLVSEYIRETDSLCVLFGTEAGERLDSISIPLDGLSGIVVREERSLYVPDLQAPHPLLPEPVTVGADKLFGSWLSVPIRVRDRTIATLAIMAEEANAYTKDDERLLETVADQLAIAIDNARLFEETRNQAERLGFLNRVSQAVNTTLDLTELLEGLHREIVSMFEHNQFLCILHREKKNELELLFGVMDGKRLPRETKPFGGFAGIVIGERRTLHVHDYDLEKNRLPSPNLAPGETSLPRTWLGVPLVVGDRVLGALCIMTDRPHAYSGAMERLFETLADQLAFAISNAEVFRATREAAERLGIVNRIGRAVAREDDLVPLAETVHREIAPVFEADTFFIALLNEEEQMIDFPFMIDEGKRSDSDSVPIGQGLTSIVIESKKTLHINNSEEYSRVLGEPFLFGSMKAPETWLGIPLFVEGRVIGVINVQSYKPFAYTEGQALLLETVADQIAMSFEKARLFQAAQREIEERTRAEERLAAERTLLRTIIDNIPDLIYSKDRKGRFVVANKAISELFGFDTPEELLGESLEDLLPEDDAAVYIAEEKGIVVVGNPVLDAEEQIIDQSTGQQRWLLVTKLPLVDAHGKTIGIVGIDRDITARKKAEEEVKRYLAEVEVANEEVKQFAYIVSHDLRAPLVNLKGFSAELKNAMEVLAPHLAHVMDGLEESERAEIAMLLDEDIPEALQFIETSVTRMDGFINSVLKLSRLGRRELTFQTVDVTQFVETCRQSLAHQMEERKVELIVGDLPEIIADPTAIEQIIGNLLTNAVNYLDPERFGRIEIGGERMSLGTKFWIKDNGRGISKEDEEKVFAPFRRAGKQNVVGEGMGLSYVRTMVRQHGGQIWFESEPDIGTTFFFTIADQSNERKTDGKPG